MDTYIETPVSFLKPESLMQAIEDYNRRAITIDDLRQTQDQAVATLVEQQQQAGLSTITDGGLYRIHGLRDFWIELNGVEGSLVLGGHLYQNQNAGEVIPKITGRISENVHNKVYKYLSFLTDRVGQSQIVRVDLPAPALFLLDALRNGWVEAPVYKDNLDLLIQDIAEAYNDTLKRCYELGCRQALLIDRSWQRLSDPEGSKRLLEGGINVDELAQLLLKVNEMALAELPADMRTTLYVPVNVLVDDDCTEVLNVLFSHREVDAFMFDYPLSNPEAISMLKHFPADRELVLGIVDAKHPQIEKNETVRSRLQPAIDILHPERIGITTIGGFQPDPGLYDMLAFTPDDQWHKIDQLKDIATTN
ncbi:MAG: hypothetical protein LUD17_01535 [Bacteroidales bacterium]|nr:hypothetical protein [Bacteroidales bacterium]